MSSKTAQDFRLPAEKKGDLTRCIICSRFSRAIHWHHTIPRSLGGENSLQIPLDGNCHTTLHSKSEAVCARLRGTRTEPVGAFWDDHTSESRAEPWLKILVEAMLDPPVSESDKRILLPSISVDLEVRHALEILKRDTPGITSIASTLRYCIGFTLKAKGLQHEQESSFTGHKKPRRKGNVLW